jgi:hypothetical protein
VGREICKGVAPLPKKGVIFFAFPQKNLKVKNKNARNN